MTVNLGRAVVELAEPIQEITAKLVELINTNVKPPSPVTADDVFIRAMYVASDQVNSFGGRFPADEHSNLAQLLVDSPVLVGHRKDQLPVGRTFHAVTDERDGVPWVKSYFYWLKSADRAEEFRANLDGGIYKECSIAFTFHLPECSVCGKDIRRCKHQPFESYDENGSSEKCHFNYRQVERVLETSLVYRGAMPNTAVVKELLGSGDAAENATPARSGTVIEPLADLVDIAHSSDYLVLPRYDGLAVSATIRGEQLSVTRLDGTKLLHEDQSGPGGFRSEVSALGILVGQRGKERCSRAQLEDYFQGRVSPVTRLVLNLLPSQGIVALPRISVRSRTEIRLLPYRIVTREGLEQAVNEIATKDGVEIHPIGSAMPALTTELAGGYWYCPSIRRRLHAVSPGISLRNTEGSTRLTLRTMGSAVLGEKTSSLSFDLADFDPARLKSGRRFLARKTSSPAERISTGGVLTGGLKQLEHEGDGWRFEGTGDLSGRFVLRPVKLNGEDQFLFGRLSTDMKAGETA